MIRVDKHKLIFVHLRKTGGTSLTEVLGRLNGMQIPEKDIHGWQATIHNHGPMHCGFRWDAQYADYFSFGFVRNPFDVLVSLYNNWSKGPVNRPIYRRTQQIGSFTAFVRAFFTEQAYERWSVHDTQSRMLVCQQTGLAVDYVGRFERLQEDWDEVCMRNGLPRIELPHRNRLKHPHYKAMYNRESQSLVERLWGGELATTGYSYDGPVGAPLARPVP